MSSARNHGKRSHRSQRMHYQAAGVLRRQIAATHFEREPLLAGLGRIRANLRGRRSSQSAPVKTVVGEVVD